MKFQEEFNEDFYFSAPEILATRGEGSYTNKVDVWSLGVILYICLGNKKNQLSAI